MDWLENQLSDPAREAAIAAIEEVLTPRGTQVCETEWGKNLGEGLYELRIRHSAEEIQRMFGSTLSGDEEQRHEQNEQEDGQHHEQAKEEEDEEQRGEHDEDSDRRKGRPEVLLRVYFTTDGRKVVLLLAGYDKGRYGGGKREHRAIKTARKRVTEHREQQRRDKARRRKGR